MIPSALLNYFCGFENSIKLVYSFMIHYSSIRSICYYGQHGTKIIGIICSIMFKYEMQLSIMSIEPIHIIAILLSINTDSN